MARRNAAPADASSDYAALLDRAQTTFPESVILGDGESVAGEFVRLESAPTRDYGFQPVVVFTDAADGAEKCIWLLHTALKSQFKAAAPNPGDKFVVVKLGKRLAKKSGREYDNYRVEVEGTPDKPSSGPMTFDQIDTSPDAE